MPLERIFIAFALPQEIKKKILRLDKEKQAKLPAEMRWLKPKNLHLTVAFLGNRPKSEIQKISKIVQKIALKTSAIKVKPRKLKTFGYVLALCLQSKKMEAVYQELKGEFQKQGIYYQEKHKFKPHITIARLRKNLRKRFHQKVNFPAFTIKKIVIYKSTLLKEGARYETLSSYLLRRKGQNE